MLNEEYIRLCRQYDIPVSKDISLSEALTMRLQDGEKLDIALFNRFMTALVYKLQSIVIPDIDMYEPADEEIDAYDPRVHNPQEIRIKEFDYRYTNVETKDGLSLPFANHVMLTPSRVDVVVSANVADVNVIIQSDIGPFAYILHAEAPEAVEITLTFSFDKEVTANTLFVDTNAEYRIEDADTYDTNRFYPVTTNELSVTFTLHHYVYNRDYVYPLFIRQLAWALITYAVNSEAQSAPYTIYDGQKRRVECEAYRNHEAALEKITAEGDIILPDETEVQLYASVDGTSWHKLPYIVNQTGSIPADLSTADQLVLTIDDGVNHEIVYDGILKDEDNLITDFVSNIYTWTSPHRAIFDSVILYRAIDCWHNIELVENGGQYADGIPFDEGQYGGSNGLYFTYLYTDTPVSRLLIVPYGSTIYFNPPSSEVYTERKPTRYEYYTVAQLDLEAGENALSILMPETGNWRAIHNEHLNVQYLHRYIDGQVERFMPIPIHHFPEVMYPKVRTVQYFGLCIYPCSYGHLG